MLCVNGGANYRIGNIYIPIYLMLLYRPIFGFAKIHTKFCVIGGGSGGLNMSSHLVKDLKAKG